LPGLYQVDGMGRVLLDANRQPIPDATGVPVFDPARITQIKDIWLILNYRYDELGECGEPIEAWAHFWDSATPYYSTTGVKLPTSWIADDIAGVAAWGVAQGRMTQTAAARSIITLAAGATWGEIAVSTEVGLPAAAGAAAGVVFRYRPPGGGMPRGDYYLARLTRLGNGHLEVGLDVHHAGAITNLSRAELTALASLDRFELCARAQGQALEVHVNGRLVLRATDASTAIGSVGLFADGAAVDFSEVLVSNLTGR
jgi:hypothetical protein